MSVGIEARAGQWSTRFGHARVTFGHGAIDQLGECVRALGGSRVLLVTDPGVRAAGHVERASRSLRSASARVFVFDQVGENPTTRHVENGVRHAKDHDVDLLVGLGGGSVMDCAKGINFLLSNGGRMEDYWGSERASQPMLPSIGIPTTAGSGSEAQSYALIEQETTRRKMACGDAKARFMTVILDPGLTETLPRQVAAVTGMDAVSHALESYVTRSRNPMSQMFAREAWALIDRNLETVLNRPDDVEARGKMLIGAHLAGAAIEGSMLGAAHACANPLTSRFPIRHGAAVLLMLPHVIRFNEPVVGPLYKDLEESSSAGRRGVSLVERVVELRAEARLPAQLRDCSVPAESLSELAKEASEQWTAGFNPRPVQDSDLLEIYEAAF